MDVDTATGLYYNNARWYNPSLGVFATTDPAAADPNTYRYAGNNPVTVTDPSGQEIPRNYVWDPNINDFVDTFSGQTRTQIRGTEAETSPRFRRPLRQIVVGSTITPAGLTRTCLAGRR